MLAEGTTTIVTGNPDGFPDRDEGTRPRPQAYTTDGAGNYGADPLADLCAAIDPVSDAVMTYFYGHLFAIEPPTRAMFPPAMDAQRACFWQALTRLVTQRHNAGQLAAYLAGLGRAHRKFGVQKEHFDAVRQAARTAR